LHGTDGYSGDVALEKDAVDVIDIWLFFSFCFLFCWGGEHANMKYHENNHNEVSHATEHKPAMIHNTAGNAKDQLRYFTCTTPQINNHALKWHGKKKTNTA
jgi:hypothetical protein